MSVDTGTESVILSNMTTTTKITTGDNGYFAVATRACGHTARITTEYDQYARRTDRKRYAKIIANEIAKIDHRSCRKCEELVNS